MESFCSKLAGISLKAYYKILLSIFFLDLFCRTLGTHYDCFCILLLGNYQNIRRRFGMLCNLNNQKIF